ncbi:hypothetical protein A2767_05505 [Candidatus Roizmanbacteria bacterium RIFCSPHIGHO2_01_FULL_35_10]|uniref:Lactate dehydrogenase n=1 Tax=Candidatus Roizmanbacteria bacterium RIFCSPLOWO2_01_FULL_35_13 TaxID=1802055 RepID=A0A1F7IBL2_9BACT|nr:MAG: hypothetical protein A2767_05505 [Candidatus Roizmanbacteria bacterium RIFCSPHIGHO2_01_FULL_35_10]OGK40748.1 MAG: hypothetical protein A3A74_03975 [Candidatus Roizmanbacteria bacterium RIFCSPLOWO2_01_FULL_35_13]
MKISIKELEKFIKKALLRKYDEKETDLITKVVMFGELSGKTSHGIVRLEGILAEKPKGKPKLISKTKVSSIIVGNGNPGMLIGSLAMDEIIRLAEENSVGFVGARGTFSSSGSLSYYLEKIAKANLIAIIMAQSPESTPPLGGIQPLFGTNPIAFGFPSKNNPFIFDMGTSAISYGALLKAKALGQNIPKDSAIDKDGNMTTDPNKAIDGATLPFVNSYKGAGLAMIVEILAGLWPNAWFTIHNKTAGWGNIFIAMSPTLLMDEHEFKEKLSLMIETVRNSKTKDGNKVRISGEKTIITRDKNLKRGYVEIEEVLINKLRKFIN